jgi:hypothetical protein
MSTDLSPIVGNWYQPLGKGQAFVVVSLDEEEGVIEIQHYDGDVEEIDLDAWSELELEAAEPPEEWTGPIDDVEIDDLGYTETGMTCQDWPQPLQEAPAGREEQWEAPEPEDELNERAEGNSAEELYGQEPQE